MRRQQYVILLGLTVVVALARGQTDDPQLLGSTMVVRGLKMYVFGGMTTNSTIPQNILWQYDMSSRLWTQVTSRSPDKPPGRTFHQATLTWDSRYMVIYGGIHCFTRIQMVSLEKGLKEYHMQQDSLEYTSALEDVWMFDFVTEMWLEVSPQRYTRTADCPTAEGVKKLENGAIHGVSVTIWLQVLLILMSIAASV